MKAISYKKAQDKKWFNEIKSHFNNIGLFVAAILISTMFLSDEIQFWTFIMTFSFTALNIISFSKPKKAIKHSKKTVFKILIKDVPVYTFSLLGLGVIGIL